MNNRLQNFVRYFWSDKNSIVVPLLAVAGIVSLLVSEQIMTGWIALGERANISRRDINTLELAVIIISFVWGLLALWAAWRLWQVKWQSHQNHELEGYFRGEVSITNVGVLVSFGLFVVLAVVFLALAEQVATGWLALGERANISRRDLNIWEWSAIIGAGAWGLVGLRTAVGFWLRHQATLVWAQWVSLVTSVVGVALFYDAVLDIDTIVTTTSPLSENLAEVLWLLAPGLVLTLSSMAVYVLLSRDVETTADETIRNTLAATPGAGAIIGFFVIFIGFSLATERFIQPRSLAGILSNNATSGIIAIGITILMISGEFDLSVGSIYGASSLVFLLMMTEGAHIDLILFEFTINPLPVLPSAIFGVGFGIFLGLINGLVLIRTGIPSFIVTLGTMLAYRAIPLLIIPDGRILRYADKRLPPPTIYFSPWVIMIGILLLMGFLLVMAYPLLRNFTRSFQQQLNGFREDTHSLKDVFLAMSFLRLVVTILIVGGLILFFLWAISNQLDDTSSLVPVNAFSALNGQIRTLPVIGNLAADVNLRLGVLWWLLLVIFFQFILMQTPYGNYSFAVGGNPAAARAQGVSVNGMKLMNFMLCGGLAGVAGLLYVARVTSVNANLGDGLELEVIAAAVIGGALLSGGYGSVFGALLGVLISGMLQTGLVLVGMNPRVFFGVNGIIIILAVIVNTAVRQRKS